MTTRTTKSINKPVPVGWLDKSWNFYAIPGDFSLSSSQCFLSGRIYGIDISSGAAVAVLLTDTYDKQKIIDDLDNKNFIIINRIKIRLRS